MFKYEMNNQHSIMIANIQMLKEEIVFKLLGMIRLFF